MLKKKKKGKVTKAFWQNFLDLAPLSLKASSVHGSSKHGKKISCTQAH